MVGFLSQDQFARKSAGEQQQLLPLGYHYETKETLYLPEIDRFAGTYILGVQGVGKSGLLENMIEADTKAGRAVVVIDPHGDLVSHCLAALPAHRLPQTYVLDMEDEGYPFGINLFALSGKLTSEIARMQAVERIMHVFEVLWGDVLSQQHLPRYVRAATIVFLDNPGATLVDMLTFLTDEHFRARLLRNVTDPTVRQFWRSQFDELSDREQSTRIQPLINRLESLFMGRSLVRNIVGQRKTTISFRRAIENREIVFVKLPVKTVAQDARLIGMIIIAQISAAIFSFADIPEAQRPGLSLYVDEFQHFATTDFSALFTEGRKFGIKVTLAHQYRNQLPDFLQDSTMTARTKICFQTTADDGREMAPLFPAQNDHIAAEDLETHPVKYLLERGSDNPPVRIFVDTYLRPLQVFKRGGKVEIEDKQFVVDWIHGSRQQQVYVANPTPYLDNLLYEVMRDQDPNKRVPWDAVVGFSNSGKKFTQQAKYKDDPRWGPDVTYPPHLVVHPHTAEQRWTRHPENSTEQLYHFIFHLRAVMRHLAAHPIGKKTQPNTSAVAQWLTSLPQRSAFVRSGDDVGAIYTHNTPPEVRGEELQRHREAIQAQTRAKYCHSSGQVQQLLLAEAEPITRPVDAVGVTEIAGWGEIGEP